MAGAKKVVKIKGFFKLVNHGKEFWKSVHTIVVFLKLFARASNGHHYSRRKNFWLKIGRYGVYTK